MNVLAQLQHWIDTQVTTENEQSMLSRGAAQALAAVSRKIDEYRDADKQAPAVPQPAESAAAAVVEGTATDTPDHGASVWGG